ncbi:MAG TPA: 4Fe-4S dicluster domain-containing protein [Clostridia bacterium]|nr:4Fe-4S dicluster domain-containing protein [Clostridia bacterium]
MKTRRNIRLVLTYAAMFLFPLTFNYLSPYVSIDGAMAGLVSGSVAVFALQFLSGIFLGRAWCAWACPVAGVAEIGRSVNDRRVDIKKLAILRYSIFGVWFLALAGSFVLAGGIKGFDPLHLTESVVSIDTPLKFITYYLVLTLLVVLTFAIGRRGACHAICWMAPFMTAGELIGRALHIPQLKIRSTPKNCVSCGLCTKRCPMSIDVETEIKSGHIKSLACIRCGECADGCPKKVLRFGMR